MIPRPINPRGVFFDFDGTLAETLSDLAHSVNHTLRTLDRPERSFEEVRLFVGNGVRHLMQCSLGEEGRPLLTKALAIFEQFYDVHLLDHTVLLPGVRGCLDHFSDRSLAIISNKPAPFSIRIAEALGIRGDFPLVLGPEALDERKPAPFMLDKAMEHFELTPGECALVGDTPVDIETGRAAGVFTVAVLGGFRTREELEAASPDVIINDLTELSPLFS